MKLALLAATLSLERTPMRITYDTTRDDLIETAYRTFIRGRTYRINLWLGTVMCAAGFAFLALLGFQDKTTVNLPVLCLAAAAWGAGLYLLTYKSAVRRRITRYVNTELKGDWPRPTIGLIADGKLTIILGGQTTAYALSDLQTLTEDRKGLTLGFGASTTCFIPLRAFTSDAEKTTFRDALNCR